MGRPASLDGALLEVHEKSPLPCGATPSGSSSGSQVPIASPTWMATQLVLAGQVLLPSVRQPSMHTRPSQISLMGQLRSVRQPPAGGTHVLVD